MAISNANTELMSTLGRSPTVADIATHLKVTEEEVLEGLEGARAYSAASLSTPVSADESMSLGDTLGEEDREYELTEMRMILGAAMSRLDEREQQILSLRFYGNMTQSDIATRVGVSQMHVSRLITKALAKLREDLNRD